MRVSRNSTRIYTFICKFLDGEANMLALNSEIGSFDKEHKSGSELWRLLVFSYEKSLPTTL